MALKLLSILIPVYNEAQTVFALLQKVANVQLHHDVQKEIIIVNDCSTDNSHSRITDFITQNPSLSIIYIRKTKNEGKGAALHQGIHVANGDYILIQDADLEYNPDDYNDLLTPIWVADADVVYGSRFIGSKPHRVLFFWHTIGNRFLTFLCNWATNLNLTDMETCYKVFRRSLIQQISLYEKRFGFEPEVTIKMARFPNIKIYEVGIAYYGRTYQEGKKVNWKDGLRAVYCIFKYGFFNCS